MNPIPDDFSAAIFDLDGTLLDTEPLYTLATDRVLEPFGKKYTMELKRRVMGGDSRRSARITIDELNLPLSVEEFLAQREVHLETLFPTAPEIASAGQYLTSLKNAGTTIGLATSSHLHACEIKTGHRDWRQHFSTIVCGDDKDLHNSKPAPDIFLLCAERLGADASKAVAFEDSRNGILAAKAAGMFVVALDSIYVTDEDLVDADVVIPDYSVLL